MHTSFNNFIESTSKTLEHHTENPNDKYEVRPCDEPGTPFAVWEGDLRVKCFKTEEEAQAYADSENEKQGLDEGTMSDIHQLAGEVKDLAEFTKEFFKRFGDKIKKTADSVEWVKTLYSDMANESIDEISQNEGIFDRFRKRSIKGTVDKEPYYFDIADKALLYLQKQDKEWRKYKLASVGPGDKKTHIMMQLMHKTNHKTADPEFMVYHDKNDNIEKVVKLEFNYESIVTEAKPAGLTKEETLKVAQKFADAIAEVDGVKVTVNMKTLEEDSFDLDYDGTEFDGGSYNINADGSVVNMAVRKQPTVGTKDDDVKTIVKFMKKHYGKLAKNESAVTEALEKRRED